MDSSSAASRGENRRDEGVAESRPPDSLERMWDWTQRPRLSSSFQLLINRKRKGRRADAPPPPPDRNLRRIGSTNRHTRASRLAADD